jgi:hypothetical protein
MELEGALSRLKGSIARYCTKTLFHSGSAAKESAVSRRILSILLIAGLFVGACSAPATTPAAQPLPPNVPAEAPARPLAIDVALAVKPDTAAQNDLLNYQVTIRNTDTVPASGLELQITLPPAVHWEKGDAGEYEPGTRTVTAMLKDIAPGGELSYGFTTRLLGIPEGDTLTQAVSVVQPNAGPIATAKADAAVDNPVAEATFTEEGGTLKSGDGHVWLDVDRAGYWGRPVRIQQQWGSLGDMQPGQPGGFYTNNLTAADAETGEVIAAFKAPVKLTLRLGDFVPAGQSFYLMRQNEQGGAWEIEAGPVTLDQAGGVQVELTRPGALAGWNGDPNK